MRQQRTLIGGQKADLRWAEWTGWQKAATLTITADRLELIEVVNDTNPSTALKHRC